MSTKSSKTIGILRSQKGCSAIFPFRCWYLVSVGWTATAVSPSIVSIRVVATMTSSSVEGKERQMNISGFAEMSQGALSSSNTLIYLIRPPCKQKTPKLQTPLSLCNLELAAASCHWAPSYPPANQPFFIMIPQHEKHEKLAENILTFYLIHTGSKPLYLSHWHILHGVKDFYLAVFNMLHMQLTWALKIIAKDFVSSFFADVKS